MWSDQQLARAIRAAGEDSVRDLRRRSLYRVVDEDKVLKNLLRRLEQDARLEQIYRAGKPSTQEITRQAHFAFFEEIHKLLKSGPRQRQTFEELARYFYQRAIASLYELAPQYVSSDQVLAHMEFKHLAFEASQAAVVHVYERIARTGGIANPSHFYTYASCAIRRQCVLILSKHVANQTASQVSPGLGTPSSLGSTAQFDESSSVLGMDVTQIAQQKVCSAVLIDATRVLVNPNQRGIAALLLAGCDHGKIATLLNRSGQEVVASISNLFEDWSIDVSLKVRLRSCSENG